MLALNSESYPLERGLLSLERALSKAACIPIVGVIPGIIKIGLGVIQAISALALAIIFSLPCCSNPELRNRALSHIAHGLGNIAAGIFEAIPIIGSIIGAFRLLPEANKASWACYEDTNQNDRFMQYKNILEVEIKGSQTTHLMLKKEQYDALPADVEKGIVYNETTGAIDYHYKVEKTTPVKIGYSFIAI